MKTRIKKIEYFRALSPLSHPIADATHSIERIAFVVTRIELESGVIGESNLLAFEYSPEAIAGALRDIAPLALEYKAYETGRFMKHALANAEYFGNVGLNRWAAGAINIAMWDAWEKRSISRSGRYWGPTGTRFPCTAAEAGWATQWKR